MRVPKFRIRTLMIAVAVLGIAFGGLAGLRQMDQRRQRFRALARNHLVNRLTLIGLAEHQAAKADTERYRMRAEYHLALNQKYQYAASHPWLPVSSDPPEPR